MNHDDDDDDDDDDFDDCNMVAWVWCDCSLISPTNIGFLQKLLVGSKLDECENCPRNDL